MILTHVLIGHILTVTGTTGLVTMTIADWYKKYKLQKKEKLNIEVDKELDIKEQYTQFFINLGLIDPKKGDWIDCLGVWHLEYYSLVKFRLSDTLSVEKFQRDQENIMQKLQVQNLDISYENGLMVFKVRSKELPIMLYDFKPTAKNLIPLGVDLDGNIVYWNIKQDPHCMIIGGTGAGKSVLLNDIINHIYNNSPNSKQFLIDCKNGMELGIYENTKNVVSYAENPKNAQKVITAVEEEFEARSKVLKEAGYRDYSKFVNDKPNTSMKRAFFIIDEFPDLNDADPKMLDKLVELLRKVRAVGIHVLLASQRATVDSIPSNLKNNIQCRIGMRTADAHNSNLILGHEGLEKLNPGEAIGIINNQETFFKAYLIDDNTIMETVNKFSKVEEIAKNTKTSKNPKVKDLFK